MEDIIPNRIQPWRVARALTQGGLAKKVGISRQALNGAETGRSTLSLIHALRVARTLRVEVEDIYSVDGFEGRQSPAKAMVLGVDNSWKDRV